MKRQETNHSILDEYGLDEVIDVAFKNRDLCPWSGYHSDEDFNLARNGWEEGLQTSLPMVESALKTVEVETELPSFEAEWLMTGSEVDVGRYLQGVPECMIEYRQVTVSRVGKIVTLCAGLNVVSMMGDDAIRKRGAIITALAMALERCNHGVEIWVDCSGSFGNRSRNRAKDIGTVRVLVKGAHDVIDPARIAFALGHPAMLRGIMHTVRRVWEGKWHISTVGLWPQDAPKNLPDGTIYIPANVDDRYILSALREIGLVE